MPVPMVTVYSRPGCRLCEKLMAQLEGLRAEAEFTWQEVNIDEDPVLRERYNEQVPVVAISGEDVFFHRLDAAKFLEKAFLSAPPAYSDQPAPALAHDRHAPAGMRLKARATKENQRRL